MMQQRDFDNDIVVLAGYWEPNSFLIRAGRAYVGIEEDQQAYSEEMAKKLSDIGVNIVIWHYYKGLGLKTEEPEMLRTKEFFSYLDKYGIVKGAYINAGSIFADTFLAEVPEAKDWIAVDQFGMNQQYSEYYRNYYRWRLCSSNNSAGKYFGKAAVKAIEDAGAEFIHFDNCSQMPCYCENCKKIFIDYILGECDKRGIDFEKWFGHKFNGTIELPRGTARMPIDNLPSAHETIIYEWVRFRQMLYECGLKNACQMIREKDSSVKINSNLAVEGGEFSGLVRGLDGDMAGRCKLYSFFSEDSNFAGIENGKLISRIRTYNYGRALDCRVITHNEARNNHKETLLNYLEAAVYNNGCLGRVMWATDADNGQFDVLKKIVRFLKVNKNIYINAVQKPKVAIYIPVESEVAFWAETRVSRLAIEQILIKNSIQFDYIVNDSIDKLNEYELLICANTICVSDKNVKKIANYVKSGGKVLCTEQSFSRNEFLRKRLFESDMGLLGERDDSIGKVKQKSSIDRLLSTFKIDNKDAQNIFYFPKIDLSKEFVWDPTSSKLPVIDKAYFLEPENTEDFLSVLDRILSGLDINIEGAGDVIGCLNRTQGNALILHVLDYQARGSICGLNVSFKLNENISSLTAEYVTMDFCEKVSLKKEGNRYSCELPKFSIYGFLEIK